MERSLLGKIVRSRRLDLNISQRELASRMQCDVKTISEIEKGIRKKPRIETLEKLSDELFIELEDLINYAGYDDESVNMYYEHKYYEDIEDNNFEDENILNEIPFSYVLTIVGKGLVNSCNKREAQKKAAEFISEALCGTIGINNDWDEILDNSENSFVCVNILKDDDYEYRRN